MPFFKTTNNIFVDNGEYFETSWMDSEELFLPFKKEWDYKREMTIDDVDFWETIFDNGWYGVYASYSPYAEFYLIKKPPEQNSKSNLSLFETFYGAGAMHTVVRRMKEIGIPVSFNKYWIDPQDAWLYQS